MRLTRGMAKSAVLSLCLCACSGGSDDGDDDDGDDAGEDAGNLPDASRPDAGDPDGDAGTPLCIRALFGRYLVREEEGALLFDSAMGQRAVLDDATGQPLLDVKEVQDGLTHGCAVIGDPGTAWCWRVSSPAGNARGQLGNGTTDTQGPIFAATQVLTGPDQPLENVAAISYEEKNGIVNAAASCAVTTGGELYCWGNLTWIKNGGVALTSPYAVPITTDDGQTPLSGVIQAAVFPSYACAVVEGTPNELYCWGFNGTGQLGQDDTDTYPFPTRVTGVDNPSKVVAHSYIGLATTCVLDESRVRCWGHNNLGQTGTDSAELTIFTRSLVEVLDGSALDDVVDLHGGGAQFCVLRSGDTVWCWGYTYERYATAYGISNIRLLGGAEAGPRYLTSDGVYHIDNIAREPNCGLLP